MTNNTKQLITIYELLPANDQNILLELSKKMLLAYDPYYTKVLPSESKELDAVLTDYRNNVNIVDDTEINW